MLQSWRQALPAQNRCASARDAKQKTLRNWGKSEGFSGIVYLFWMLSHTHSHGGTRFKSKGKKVKELRMTQFHRVSRQNWGDLIFHRVSRQNWGDIK